MDRDQLHKQQVSVVSSDVTTPTLCRHQPRPVAVSYYMLLLQIYNLNFINCYEEIKYIFFLLVIKNARVLLFTLILVYIAKKEEK
jgi:hypothetical protein